MEAAVAFLALLGLVLIGGAVCGIVALIWLAGVDRRLGALQRYVSTQTPPAQAHDAVPPRPVGAPAPAEPQPARETPAAPAAPAPRPEPARLVPRPPEERRTPAPPVFSGPTFRSFESALGGKWLAWVGIVFFLIGLGLGLKYAYDLGWIGPKGRLAIGTILGVIALGFGERFRRTGWPVLFQALTGGGLAAFYICIFFSFQVYGLSGQGLSMGLAACVTLLAVVLAVAHDAPAIAILGLVGGFLSPVLLSTGENHPYALFIFIAILDLVAMGSAYFRRWRALDLLSFAGTALLYQGWYLRFYNAPDQPSQMVPALVFTSLFYLMFLLIPTLHALVRRLPERVEGLVLVAANAAFSFYCYYNVLFDAHRRLMGFVVLGQALLVFLLFQAWVRRVGGRGRMAESLLVTALALVTVAVPVQLKLYAVPLTWALEGVLFAYLGVRFNRLIVRSAGLAALVLATGGLLDRLPLHTARFTPLLNIPFASWGAVVVAGVVTAWLLAREKECPHGMRMAAAAFLLAFALGCAALTLEVWHGWTEYAPADYRTHRAGALVILWAAIPAITATVLGRRKLDRWMPLPLVCYGIGGIIFLLGLAHYRLDSPWFLFNYTFPARLAFIPSLWWGGRVLRRSGPPFSGDALTVAGHGLLTILLAFEILRWGASSDLLSNRMAVSFISAAWGLQGFALIWLGLVTRNRARRILGFGLFALTIAKVCFYDLANLDRVYQIVSFGASGLVFLVANYFYHRYANVLLADERREDAK